ncbi:MAG TPA: hypothetical protein VH330_08470 [Candidatus Udaeobacter sp.]|jgi:hypothetical protein
MNIGHGFARVFVHVDHLADSLQTRITRAEWERFASGPEVANSIRSSGP